MNRALIELRRESNASFIADAMKEREMRTWGWGSGKQKMLDGRLLDYESEQRVERAYLGGFVDACIEFHGLTKDAAIILDDLRYNLIHIKDDRKLPSHLVHAKVECIPEYMEHVRSDNDLYRDFSTNYIARWKLYNDLFSENNF